MDSLFYNSLTDGDFGNGFHLGQSLLDGDFWPRSNGCHVVLRGQDGHFGAHSIVAIMALADTSVTIAAQNLPAGTIWHYARRQVSGCGKASGNSVAAIVRIAADGTAITPSPNAPTHLKATVAAGGKIKLSWRYSARNQLVGPTGFHVYIDSGSGFDFDTPAATVTIPSITVGYAEKTWESDALSHGTRYRFVVRAYADGYGESQNADEVSAVADAVGPTAITGLISSTTEMNE